MVSRFAWGPSLIQGLFKECRGVFAGTFHVFSLFQGRSAGLHGDLPYFEGFLRKVEGFAVFDGFNGRGVKRNMLIYNYLAKTSRWIQLIHFR